VREDFWSVCSGDVAAGVLTSAKSATTVSSSAGLSPKTTPLAAMA